MMDVTSGVRKGWFSWVFRGSAFLHILAAVFMLCVLAQTTKGSLIVRSTYISANQTLVVISWFASSLAILSVIVTFTVLTFALDKTYRPLLQWAWMISVIGGAAIFLNHFIQMTVISALSELFILMPSPELASHMYEWDKLLQQVIGVFSPSCFAISGLIYTAVMFRTRDFPSSLSWWSFLIWTILLTGAIVFRWEQEAEQVLLGVAIFIYIPWLWYAADQVKPHFTK
ncbi:DUF4386 family protein [Paenactinomyces guangxiensis]|uniref:DUF4386 family protein n=1 Tax=Paenactinomyces guangxiensis TaxID=1490290 RepID=A0A7W1WT19_9BACL|nr:DUF4386 family protein [Paenactinomyces guangxiensis]MBA4495463.1 DUF4386 family protein [Paenactinomyces guangxiensis]MBH8592414.1 DUF4386 family protein [Paenactinomyces guangxiensis]